jgi:predicted N-acetyltransferase YhbS
MGDILNQKAKNGIKKLQIREAVETDLNDVLQIERLAFGYEKEADLVRGLLSVYMYNYRLRPLVLIG